MSKNSENPPYITVVNIGGHCVVNRMEWDKNEDGYMVTQTRNIDCAHAKQFRDEWAQAEGLEVR